MRRIFLVTLASVLIAHSWLSVGARPIQDEPPRTVVKPANPIGTTKNATAKLDLADQPKNSVSQDPTMPATLTLDFKDRPINEVVAAISARTGNNVVLQFWNDVENNPRKVTLLAPTPIPFWDAMDRLAEATKLQRVYNDGGGFGGRQANVSLYGPGSDPGPAVYSGPFRFGNFTLHANYDRVFVPSAKPPNDQDSGAYRAEFDVLTEPRVIAIRTGPLTNLDAIDDRGGSLLDTSPNDPEKTGGPLGGYGLGSFQPKVRVRLVRPSPESTRLKRLRGVMPVEVGIPPKQPTLVIPLKDAAGKTFRTGDLALTIEEFVPRPGGSTSLRVLAKIEGDRGPSGKSLKGVVWARSGAIHRQIEIVDAEGRVLAASSGGSSMGDELRLNYSFSPVQQGRPGSMPTHLRVYAPKWVQWDAPFEFADIPLP
ncbi:MAG: hypothetical protein JWN86_2955 [Planctomycetota bacterium]|nr:hypothetical protein [Planctomycetota bacterium]